MEPGATRNFALLFDPDLDFTIYIRAKTDKNQQKLAFIFSGVQPDTEKHMNDVLSPTDSTTVMCLKILDNLQKAKQKQMGGPLVFDFTGSVLLGSISLWIPALYYSVSPELILHVEPVIVKLLQPFLFAYLFCI